ncbi:uncharacterized protein [Solanum tuberosum]|uniref:uncharacterized protein isoform X5 n=1 Tax=Solanum tuberosum TaxID=4113 RepID=UPI00073A322E|nr:PREDICTED: uncharacterized protein LOC102586186 isoform X5 [Solanum tuberosum]
MDKKVIPPASSSQEKACQYSTDRASIINNRRCSIYKQLSSDKKEALLLQRRRRYRQLTNKNLLGRAPTPLPNVQLHFTAEKGVTITDIPPHPETVVSGKAKDMIGCLSIFEVGSTLAAPVKQHSPIAITVTTKGSASLAHQQYDPKAITDKNNGNRLRSIYCCNIKQLPNNPSILKKMPSCEYCAAKRFQYESAGFCCSNGTVKLASHEMPTDLLNLLLGDTAECKHFRTYIRMYNNMFAFTSLGVKYDKELAKRYHGIYTFRVQGQMYHFINDFITFKSTTKKSTIIYL